MSKQLYIPTINERLSEIEEKHALLASIKKLRTAKEIERDSLIEHFDEMPFSEFQTTSRSDVGRVQEEIGNLTREELDLAGEIDDCKRNLHRALEVQKSTTRAAQKMALMSAVGMLVSFSLGWYMATMHDAQFVLEALK
jgi:hypothetical protein